MNVERYLEIDKHQYAADRGPCLEAARTHQPVRASIVGSLNLYSHTAEGFDPFDEALRRLFSTAATRSISNARRWQQSRDQVHNLETALEQRSIKPKES